MSIQERNPHPHQPVLYHESLKYLQPKSGGRYVDGTLGAGGHAEGILSSSSPGGLLLGLDVDNMAIDISTERLKAFGNRCIIHHVSFVEILDQIKSLDWNCIDGLLLDLGLSSMQLDTTGRGFSFLKEANLDLRFNQQKGKTAAELINSLSEGKIADIIWNYSEEPRARKIAKLIIKNRPISTTTELADLIFTAYLGKRGRTHPATRTFQALRIAVNNELEVLEKGLENSLKALCTGGRIVVITFHSLEDRIVKHKFKRESVDCICPPDQPLCNCEHQSSIRVITKKAVKPSQEEITNNPRSRSAKMRVAEKI